MEWGRLGASCNICREWRATDHNLARLSACPLASMSGYQSSSSRVPANPRLVGLFLLPAPVILMSALSDVMSTR
jgi:hypothetical protein